MKIRNFKKLIKEQTDKLSIKGTTIKINKDGIIVESAINNDLRKINSLATIVKSYLVTEGFKIDGYNLNKTSNTLKSKYFISEALYQEDEDGEEEIVPTHVSADIDVYDPEPEEIDENPIDELSDEDYIKHVMGNVDYSIIPDDEENIEIEINDDLNSFFDDGAEESLVVDINAHNGEQRGPLPERKQKRFGHDKKVLKEEKCTSIYMCRSIDDVAKFLNFNKDQIAALKNNWESGDEELYTALKNVNVPKRTISEIFYWSGASEEEMKDIIQQNESRKRSRSTMKEASGNPSGDHYTADKWVYKTGRGGWWMEYDTTDSFWAKSDLMALKKLALMKAKYPVNEQGYKDLVKTLKESVVWGGDARKDAPGSGIDFSDPEFWQEMIKMLGDEETAYVNLKGPNGVVFQDNEYISTSPNIPKWERIKRISNQDPENEWDDDPEADEGEEEIDPEFIDTHDL